MKLTIRLPRKQAPPARAGSEALLAMLPPAVGRADEVRLAEVVKRYMEAPFAVEATLEFIERVDRIGKPEAERAGARYDCGSCDLVTDGLGGSWHVCNGGCMDRRTPCIKGAPGASDRCVCDACCGYPEGYRTTEQQMIDNIRVRREAEYREFCLPMPPLAERVSDAKAELARSLSATDAPGRVIVLEQGVEYNPLGPSTDTDLDDTINELVASHDNYKEVTA
jgi:hypothetical protein